MGAHYDGRVSHGPVKDYGWGRLDPEGRRNSFRLIKHKVTSREAQQARASQAAKRRKIGYDNYLPQSVLQFLDVEEEQ